jgi:hypothetical protein
VDDALVTELGAQVEALRATAFAGV